MRIRLDHIFDHLRIRTTWKQCDREHPKASISDTKAPKSLVNQGKNRYIFLGVVEAASSSLVTQTSSEVHNEPPNFLYFTGFFGHLDVCTASKTSAIFFAQNRVRPHV